MTTAVVPAAGTGARLKESLLNSGIAAHPVRDYLSSDPNCPKALLPLNDRPVLWWTLQSLASVVHIGHLIIAAPEGYEEAVRSVAQEIHRPQLFQVITGGATRQESVARCLHFLPEETRWIVVHDGVRPFVTPRIVASVWLAAQMWGAATAAVPCTDTMKESFDGIWIRRTVDRKSLWAVQTPQVFARYLLVRAHHLGREKGWRTSDDAALVEKMGIPVRLVPSDPWNIKLTTLSDFTVADALIRLQKVPP
ncbi:MAG: 2-C-methyl-D-erythritol 4-phosphate cytidylyltransferase [Armatimonadetes bacterium]|nr:2-C-methyl-D-erythritol 4-phosphate cytidylyltransferase [Armatimonadota bacterium]MDW8121656.1 2-C-methyl-D-erythritol 4-phosphate cytidylyltransferase [Armatimonadota bacterium]